MSRRLKHNLLKPVLHKLDDEIDETLLDDAGAENHEIVSDAFLSLAGDAPFLCSPLPVTNANLLAWLMRGNNNKNNRYEPTVPSLAYKRGKKINETKEYKAHRKAKEDYHRRREEMRVLAYKYELNTASIDRDGRLLDGNEEFARGQIDPLARADVIPPWLQNNVNINPLNNENGNVNGNVNGNENAVDGGGGGGGVGMGILGILFGFGGQEQQEEDDNIRRLVEYHEREAAQAIEVAVRQYRNDGVPEDDFEFIRLTPRGEFHMRAAKCKILQ